MARKKAANKAQTEKKDREAARPKAKSDQGVPAKMTAVNAFLDYLKQVRVEFDKITWANKKETVGITVAVLAITFFFAAYLGLVDFALTNLLGLLY